MKSALLQGDDTLKVERTPRLQPQGSLRSHSSLGDHPHSVVAYTRQAPAQVKPPAEVPSARAEPYPAQRTGNVGSIRKLIAGVWRTYRDRRRKHTCSPSRAETYFGALALLEEAAVALDADHERRLEGWALKDLRLSPEVQAQMLAELRANPVITDAKRLGVLVGELIDLSTDERERLKFWTAVAADQTEAAQRELKRAKDRQRKAKDRRKAGIPVKGEAFARARALDPDAARSTLYDRIARKKPRKKRGGKRHAA